MLSHLRADTMDGTLLCDITTYALRSMGYYMDRTKIRLRRPDCSTIGATILILQIFNFRTGALTPGKASLSTASQVRNPTI